MGRARENFNDVYFKDLRGQQMSFAGYANVLRHIFWNLMDGHSMVRESEKCNYTIEAWGFRPECASTAGWSSGSPVIP